MADEVKTQHIWLPNNRSLCDRRTRPPARYDKMTDSEFEAHVQEQTSAPACGSCLILAVDLHHQACGIAKATAANGIAPAVQTEALRQIAGTGWDRLFDVEATAEAEDDTEISLANLMTPMDEAVLNSMADRCTIKEQDLREAREEALRAQSTHRNSRPNPSGDQE